jgi:predicted O-methyltransferase YrrM
LLNRRHFKALTMSTINTEIISNLYGGTSPFVSVKETYIDDNYPHTNIKERLVDYLIEQYSPNLWLELGSFVGGSALIVASAVKKNKSSTSILCCDPFCGDVNMWDWVTNPIPTLKGNDGQPYDFLKLEDGVPTIYQRFLANIYFNGQSDIVTPIQTTSIVGIRLIERLHNQGRISQLPSVIYLDSAHEIDETYLELVNAWRCLASGGILFGDDWDWKAVKKDVTKFSKRIQVHSDRLKAASECLPASEILNNILLYEGQWVLFKN